MSTTKIEIPGIGPVTVEAKPDLPDTLKPHDTFKPFLFWSANARTIKADPQDVVDAARALLCAEYLDHAEMKESRDALESVLFIVGSMLNVLEKARLLNWASAVRGEDRPFDENNLAELGHLARRLAEHGPHLLAEIQSVEERQDALWEAATADESAEAAE